MDAEYDTLGETFDQDDVGFLADPDHPLLAGQEGNGVGRYKRVFIQRNKALHKVRNVLKTGINGMKEWDVQRPFRSGFG